MTGTKPKAPAPQKKASQKPALQKKAAAKKPAANKAAKPAGAKPKLLSGDNPQIAKGEGDAPVQAYIAAVPGWKRAVCRQVDAIVTRSVPGLRKAVKWNSPFYGVEEKHWFLSFHCFANYVKVAFFKGADLKPVPPGASKQPEVRYLDIREGDTVDEALLASWAKQASKLPGLKM